MSWFVIYLEKQRKRDEANSKIVNQGDRLSRWIEYSYFSTFLFEKFQNIKFKNHESLER